MVVLSCYSLSFFSSHLTYIFHDLIKGIQQKLLYSYWVARGWGWMSISRGFFCRDNGMPTLFLKSFEGNNTNSWVSLDFVKMLKISVCAVSNRRWADNKAQTECPTFESSSFSTAFFRAEQSRLQTEERARRRRVPNNRWQVVVGARRCQVVLLPVHPPLTARAGPTGGGASAAPRAHTHVRDITPQPHAGGNYARGKTLVRKFLSFCVRSNRSLSTVNMFFVEWISVGNWMCFRRLPFFSLLTNGGKSSLRIDFPWPQDSDHCASENTIFYVYTNSRMFSCFIEYRWSVL